MPALSTVAAWYFVLPPYHSFDLLWPWGAIAPGLFVLVVAGHGFSGVIQDKLRVGAIIMEGFAHRLGGDFA